VSSPRELYTTTNIMYLDDEKPSVADGVIIVVTPIGTSEQGIKMDDLPQLEAFRPILKENRAVVLVNKL
jgi:hypothetical protein